MDGIYELVVGGVNAQGNYAENVSHWIVSSTSLIPTAWETAKQLCESFDTTCSADLAACMGTDTKINVLHARKIDGAGGPTWTDGIEVAGTGGGASFSQVVGVDIAMYPGGLGNRVGHWFMWGIDALGVIGDVLQSSWLIALNAFLGDLLSSLSIGAGHADLATYTKSTNTATKVHALHSRTKLSGFSKRTSPQV